MFFRTLTLSTCISRRTISPQPEQATVYGVAKPPAWRCDGTRKQPCSAKLVIKRVPFSLDHNLSGVAVKVRLPNGTELANSDVVVEDLFVVALGDSFASGESNPDRPVTFSATREMLYDPVNVESEHKYMASRAPDKKHTNYEVASAEDETNPKSLPKRLMEDEEKGLLYNPSSREFLTAFEHRDAQWLSADCHRSQYGYPFRVSMGLALEDRHRAVTFSVWPARAPILPRAYSRNAMRAMR